MNELKDCPFCGNDQATVTYNPYQDWHVGCDKCTMHSYFFKTREQAINAWNRRIDFERIESLERYIKISDKNYAAELSTLRETQINVLAVNVLIAAKTWFRTRLVYFAKNGKTIPEDLIPLSNAEHNLMDAIRESLDTNHPKD